MEDFIGIMVIAVIYLAIAAGTKKKKRGTRTGQARKTTQRESRFDEAFSAAQSASPKDLSAARHSSRQADRDMQQPDTQAAIRPQVREAGEGEDPCHPAGLAASRTRAPEEAPAFPFGEPSEPDAMAQELVRGVIMSEILKRPCERAAERRYGRRAS